jgi:drug/metabolite transporter (DMT)-like permease
VWSWKALIGVAVWGASFVATRIALQSFTAFGLVGVRLVMGSAVLLGAGLALGRGVLPPPGRDRNTAILLGIVCSGIGYLLWYAALKELGAAVVGSYLYLEPFVTVGVSAAILGEPIGPAVVGGGVLVLIGVWAVAHGARRAAARLPELPHPEALAE